MFTFSAPNADMLLPIISKSHTVNSSLQLKNKTHLVCRQYSAHLFCIPSFRMILQLYVHRGQRYHQAGLQCASVFFQQCSNHTQEIAVSEPKEKKKQAILGCPPLFLFFFCQIHSLFYFTRLENAEICGSLPQVSHTPDGT